MNLRNFWRTYARLFDRYPLRMNMLASGILVGSGDVISQLAIEKRTRFFGEKNAENSYKPLRTFSFWAIGTFFMAPLLRLWYPLLSGWKFGGARFSPAVQVFVDQSIWAPSFLSAFLVIIHVTDGNPLDQAVDRWRKEFGDIYRTNLMIWPFVQLVNFYFIPLGHRIVLIQVVGLFWNTYLSWSAHQLDQKSIMLRKEI